MSAQRVVPPARPAGVGLRLVAAFLLGLTAGIGLVAVIQRAAGAESWSRVSARASSPDKSRVALVVDRACAAGLCQELRVGASEAAASAAATLQAPSATEVVWTADGKRVGFVIDGSELRLYDPATLKVVGTVRLLTDEAAQSRLVRGVTFSENGRAATFDDCPRTRSGCRAGLVAIPQ
jgi:hypothetical protein